ncbi:hypothetical protein EDD22DRAFT_955880 [Suillus occidentalis]|nr:hypothetical protein EDD22DRAFT_960230 [Suillus occidentalis]KAG1759424.1 hypothetical protein EDD22DRAFT_955880 [Suillus occidentalis]
MVDSNFGGWNLASCRATQALHPGFNVLQDNLSTIKGHVKTAPAALFKQISTSDIHLLSPESWNLELGPQHLEVSMLRIRPFLRSIAAFAAGFRSTHAHLCPSTAIHTDLPWVQSLLSHLPNSIPIMDPSPVDIGWWGNASTSFGIRVVVQKHWAVWHWASGFKVGPK